jgi:hypothetical protein
MHWVLTRVLAWKGNGQVGDHVHPEPEPTETPLSRRPQKLRTYSCRDFFQPAFMTQSIQHLIVLSGAVAWQPKLRTTSKLISTIGQVAQRIQPRGV